MTNLACPGGGGGSAQNFIDPPTVYSPVATFISSPFPDTSLSAWVNGNNDTEFSIDWEQSTNQIKLILEAAGGGPGAVDTVNVTLSNYGSSGTVEHIFPDPLDVNSANNHEITIPPDTSRYLAFGGGINLNYALIQAADCIFPSTKLTFSFSSDSDIWTLWLSVYRSTNLITGRVEAWANFSVLEVLNSENKPIKRSRMLARQELRRR